jgi:hypothetical protein
MDGVKGDSFYSIISMGVAKKDIVLGLQPPYIREYTGLGVA